MIDSQGGSISIDDFGDPFFKTSSRSGSSSANTGGGNRSSDSRAESAISKKIQLARQAALIMIQTFWRAILIRRKYLRVKHFKLTNDSNLDSEEFQDKNQDDIENGQLARSLIVQEKLIRRFKRYCKMYERIRHEQGKFCLPPSYQFFCATYIQAHFRMIWVHKAYKEYSNSIEKDFEALEDKLERLAGGQDFDLMDLYSRSARKIQACWRSSYVYTFFIMPSEFSNLSILS